MSYTNVIPSADNTYNLGSSAYRWKSLSVAETVAISSLGAAEAVVTDGDQFLVSLPYGSTASALSMVQRDQLGGSGFAEVRTELVKGDENVDLVVQSLGAADVQIKAPAEHSVKTVIDDADTLTIASELAIFNAHIVLSGEFTASAYDVLATNTADASSYTSAPLRSEGGLGVAGKSYLNGGVMLPTSGGTPALLDANETGSISNNWGGAIASTSGAINFSRVGKIASISWDEVSHLGNGSTALISSTSGVVPSRLRPLTSIICIAMIQNNGTWGVGHVRVLTSGTIEFYASNPSGSFNGNGQHYIPGLSFSYPVS